MKLLAPVVFVLAFLASPALAGDMANQIMAAATRLNAVPGQYEEVRRTAEAKMNPSCPDCQAIYRQITMEWTTLDQRIERDVSTLDQRAQGQQDYLRFYDDAARQAGETVTRFAQQVNQSGPGGSLCGRCGYSGGGGTAPLTASTPALREDVVGMYVQIFWETVQESDRLGNVADIPNRLANPVYGAYATATDGLYAPKKGQHNRETEEYIRQVFDLMGERDARMLINEELRESWARQGSTRRFEEKYGQFMDSF